MGILTRLGVTEYSRLIPIKRIEDFDKVPKDFRMIYREHFDSRSVFTATLFFSQLHDKVHAYTVRKYDASVRWIQNDPGERTQSFVFGRYEPFYTLREAYNLLQGRFVLKTHEVKGGGWITAWGQLDFGRTYFSGNYVINRYSGGRRYNVLAELQRRFSGHGMDHNNLLRVGRSLEMGNREMVSVWRGCCTKWEYIQANPKDRRIDFLETSD